MAVQLGEDSALARDLYAASRGLHKIAALVDVYSRNGLPPPPIEAADLTNAVVRYERAHRAWAEGAS